jgi:hypothetical protein
MWPSRLDPNDYRVRVTIDADGSHHAAGPRVDGGWLVAIVSPGARERAIARLEARRVAALARFRAIVNRLEGMEGRGA